MFNHATFRPHGLKHRMKARKMNEIEIFIYLVFSTLKTVSETYGVEHTTEQKRDVF